MELMNWKKIIKNHGEEIVPLVIEKLELDIKEYKFCIKQKKLDIERGLKFINE